MGNRRQVCLCLGVENTGCKIKVRRVFWRSISEEWRFLKPRSLPSEEHDPLHCSTRSKGQSEGSLQRKGLWKLLLNLIVSPNSNTHLLGMQQMLLRYAVGLGEQQLFEISEGHSYRKEKDSIWNGQIKKSGKCLTSHLLPWMYTGEIHRRRIHIRICYSDECVCIHRKNSWEQPFRGLSLSPCTPSSFYPSLLSCTPVAL